MALGKRNGPAATGRLPDQGWQRARRAGGRGGAADPSGRTYSSTAGGRRASKNGTSSVASGRSDDSRAIRNPRAVARRISTARSGRRHVRSLQQRPKANVAAGTNRLDLGKIVLDSARRAIEGSGARLGRKAAGGRSRYSIRAMLPDAAFHPNRCRRPVPPARIPRGPGIPICPAAGLSLPGRARQGRGDRGNHPLARAATRPLPPRPSSKRLSTSNGASWPARCLKDSGPAGDRTKMDEAIVAMALLDLAQGPTVGGRRGP